MGQELPAAKNLPRIKLVMFFSFSGPSAELFVCFLYHSVVLRATVIQYRGLAVRTRGW